MRRGGGSNESRCSCDGCRGCVNIKRHESEDSSATLFLKPEDVWDVNDVAAQHPDEVATLREMLLTWLNARSDLAASDAQ